MPKVDKTNCCVYNCHTCRTTNKEVSFHHFPKHGNILVANSVGGIDNIDAKKAWEIALLNGKPASNYMRVCGKHFKPEDYINFSSKKPKLKKTAIPSVNLPKRKEWGDRIKENVLQKNQRLLRAEKRLVSKRAADFETNLQVKALHNNVTEKENNYCEYEARTLYDLSEEEHLAVEALISFKPDELKRCNNCWFVYGVDKAVQVASGDVFIYFNYQ